MSTQRELKAEIKLWIDANVWDGEDRIGAKNDSACFNPDELQELVFDMAEYVIAKQPAQPVNIGTANYKDTIRKLEAARWEFKKALAKCYGIAMALCFEENPNYKAAVEKIAKISDEVIKASKGEG